MKAPLLLIAAITGAPPLPAQPIVVGSSYTLTHPIVVAPGQLVTMITDRVTGINEVVSAPSGADLPSSLSGVTAGYSQGFGTALPNAMLSIAPYWGCPVPATLCPPQVAITVQIPFEAVCNMCSSLGGVAPGQMSVIQGNLHGSIVDVITLPDQVHVLTTCDAIVLSGGGLPTATGLPCPSVVTHGDGSAVSAKTPAQPGEEVVVYAVGLGQTNPPLQTGKLVTAAASTVSNYLLDFNYRPNALAAKPLPGSPQPIYAGATPGYVGLYQVNFVVPPAPTGAPPCVGTAGLPFGSNVVESNLTVSIGGQYSFDAARLCVAVPNQ